MSVVFSFNFWNPVNGMNSGLCVLGMKYKLKYSIQAQLFCVAPPGLPNNAGGQGESHFPLIGLSARSLDLVPVRILLVRSFYIFTETSA